MLRVAAERVFSIDLRGLAAFRIAIAGVLLIDLATRVPDLVAHYTDYGFFSRGLMIRNSNPWRLSVHAMGGTAFWEALLFVIAILFACMLLLGWRTKLATISSWILLASLQSRNPLILSAGDELFVLLLFWAMFLPLGARWSVDALRSAKEPGDLPRETCTIASASIILLVVGTYFLSAVMKTGDEWRVDGTAIYLALSNGDLSRGLADWLLPHDRLLRVMTFATFWLELVGAPLVLLPVFTRWVRLGIVAAFASFHIGILVFMAIGIFPLVCLCGWLVIVPGMVWDVLEKRTIGLNAAAGRFVSKWFRRGSGPDVRIVPRALSRTLAGASLAYMIVWNIGTLFPELGVAPAFRPLGLMLRFDQNWQMFAPRPPNTDAWPVMLATLENGEEIDLARRGAPIEWSRPEDFRTIFPRYRLRKFVSNLWAEGRRIEAEHWGRFEWRMWDEAAAPERRIRRLDIFRVYQVVSPGGERSPVTTEKIVSLGIADD